MQNKPNVKDAQINVSSYMKSKYEKLDTWLSEKNKPNFKIPQSHRRSGKKKEAQEIFPCLSCGNDFKGCLLSNIPIGLIFNFYLGSLHNLLKLNKFEFLSKTGCLTRPNWKIRTQGPQRLKFTKRC